MGFLSVGIGTARFQNLGVSDDESSEKEPEGVRPQSVVRLGPNEGDWMLWGETYYSRSPLNPYPSVTARSYRLSGSMHFRDVTKP